MTEDIKPWVEALRSGNYSQQKGTLKGPDGYCCLGVYESIHGREPVESTIELDGGPYTSGPDATYQRLEDRFEYYFVQDLIQMNDGGKSFNEIADYIEEHYSHD